MIDPSNPGRNFEGLDREEVEDLLASKQARYDAQRQEYADHIAAGESPASLDTLRIELMAREAELEAGRDILAALPPVTPVAPATPTPSTATTTPMPASPSPSTATTTPTAAAPTTTPAAPATPGETRAEYLQRVKQYAETHFTGLEVEDAENLLDALQEDAQHFEERADVLGQQIDADDALPTPTLSASDRDDLVTAHDKNLVDAKFNRDVVDYVTRNHEKLGIAGVGVTADGAETPPLMSRIAGAAKRHPYRTGALLIVTAIAGKGMIQKGQEASQVCDTSVQQAEDIGQQEYLKVGDADLAAANAASLITAQADGCTTEELGNLVGAGTKGANDAARNSGSNVPTTAGNTPTTVATPTTDGQTPTTQAPSTSTTEPAPTTPEIDDTILCAPDGKVISVDVGPDGIVEDYAGDPCDYPGAGQSVVRTEGGGGTDLIVGR